MTTSLETPDLRSHSPNSQSWAVSASAQRENTAVTTPVESEGDRVHLGDRIAWQIWLVSFAILVFMTLLDIAKGLTR